MPYYKDINNKVHFLDDEKDEHMLPDGCVKITNAEAAALQPPVGMFSPELINGVWTETALVFQSKKVTAKADVDEVTRQRIINLGEEKAKTEKLLAGTNTCTIWDEFITARTVILQEGDNFISAHGLS